MKCQVISYKVELPRTSTISAVSKLPEIDLLGDGKTVFVDDEVEPQVLQIIKTAEKQITFVTPYIGLWNHLKDEIRDAMRRKVEVIFFIRVGTDPKDPSDLPWLRSNISVLYEVPNLHSKIYLNEKTVLVSSMNATAVSTRDSKEIAMLVRRQEDAKVLRDYVLRLTAKSTTKRSPSIGSYVAGLVKSTVTQSFQPIGREASRSGRCIRCGEEIPFNPKHPFCATHYRIWAKYKDEDFEEKYCHSCGKPTKTRFKKPECLACYNLTRSS